MVVKKAVSTGLNFGLTSGVITTLGLIVSLHSGTHSKLVIIGGIITIAIADSMSDALGIHISKESETSSSKLDVWVATIVTLLSKMCMAITFIIPVLIFNISDAIVISVIWGLLVIAALSYLLAKNQGENPIYVISEHLVIAIVVIIATHNVGHWVAEYFGQNSIV